MSFPDPDLDFFHIPDPGVKKAPDPGSGSATLFFPRSTCKSKPRLDNIKYSMIPGIMQFSMASFITRTLGIQITVNRRLTKSGFKPPSPSLHTHFNTPGKRQTEYKGTLEFYTNREIIQLENTYA
jgi:hypothetical protein